MSDTFLNYQALGQMVSFCIAIIMFIATLSFAGLMAITVNWIYEKISKRSKDNYGTQK